MPSHVSMAPYPVLCATNSMCLRSVLWTVIGFNVPSFESMSRYAILWTIISFYVPSHASMDPYPVLCAITIHCAFVPFYGPLYVSMSLHSVLCSITRLYVPSFDSIGLRSVSMCHYANLWTVHHTTTLPTPTM